MSFTEEQLAKRRALITATDAAAICGVSPWKTAHDVYADKLGLVPPTEPSFRMRRGLALEHLGFEWLREQRAPLVVVPSTTDTRTHPIMTWLGATPDALVFEPSDPTKPCAVGEIKTAGLRAADSWNDEDGEPCIPEHYLVQIQVQLTVVGVKRATLVAMLDTEDEPRLYDVEHDPDLESAILEACDRFRRNHLEPHVPPPLDGSDGAARLVRALFPRPTRDIVSATPDIEIMARQWLTAKEAEKEAEAQRKELERQICSRIGDHEGVAGSGWRALWSYRNECEVPAYVRKAHRVFDLRRVGKGRKAA